MCLDWTVELANHKAAWYSFNGVSQGMKDDAAGSSERLRNKLVKDRSKLSITPSSKTISGPSQKGPQFAFGDGCFFDRAVYLGELQTDTDGRLIVLGGHGTSSQTDLGTR